MKCFLEMSVQYPHSMSQEMLVETCKYNFHTSMLIKIRLVKSRTWKDLTKKRIASRGYNPLYGRTVLLEKDILQ